MVHPKTDPPPVRVRGTSSEFHNLLHCPSCFPACQACCMSPRTARKLSSKGKRNNALQRKDTSPLTLPLLGCTRLVLGVPAQPQSPNSPTLALCKGGRSGNSCCNLLVVSVDAHSPPQDAPLRSRPDRNGECDSRQWEKHFSITCAFPFTGSPSSCLACH